MEWLSTLVKWLVPPPGHDPVAELAWRWRLAAFGCVTFLGVTLIYAGLTYRWGLPDFIRPASAQEVREQVQSVKDQVAASVTTIQGQLTTIRSAQVTIQQQQHDDRLERIEQQLLWYRTQNCKSKQQVRNYTWQKMTELRDRYRALTGTDWQMPTCGDIGD